MVFDGLIENAHMEVYYLTSMHGPESSVATAKEELLKVKLLLAHSRTHRRLLYVGRAPARLSLTLPWYQCPLVLGNDGSDIGAW